MSCPGHTSAGAVAGLQAPAPKLVMHSLNVQCRRSSALQCVRKLARAMHRAVGLLGNKPSCLRV